MGREFLNAIEKSTSGVRRSLLLEGKRKTVLSVPTPTTKKCEGHCLSALNKSSFILDHKSPIDWKIDSVNVGRSIIFRKKEWEGYTSIGQLSG